MAQLAELLGNEAFGREGLGSRVSDLEFRVKRPGAAFKKIFQGLTRNPVKPGHIANPITLQTQNNAFENASPY